MSSTVDFVSMAKVAGYQFVTKVHDEYHLSGDLMLSKGKLGFILAKIELGGRRDFKRPLNLPNIKERIQLFIGGTKDGI